MTAIIDYEALVVDTLGGLEQWAYRCHEASLHLVRSGIFGERARVARGVADGVGSQHSWVVLGEDVYDVGNYCVDPTWWCYQSDNRLGPFVVMEVYGDGPWRAHGDGHIGVTGLPRPALDSPVSLSPLRWASLSDEARGFLSRIGPLDRRGWGTLFHGGMKGWPAGEIIAVAKDEPDLAALVPIDIEGMVTDRNPQGLYR